MSPWPGGRFMMVRFACVLLLTLFASCDSKEKQSSDKPIPSEDMVILVGHVYCAPVWRDWCDVTKPCHIEKIPLSLATIVSADGTIALVTPAGSPFHFERGRFAQLEEKAKFRGKEKSVEQWIPSQSGDYLLAADPCSAEVYILHFPLPKSGVPAEVSTNASPAEEVDPPLPAEWVPGTLECFKE